LFSYRGFYTSKLHYPFKKTGIETLLKYAYAPGGINPVPHERLLRKKQAFITLLQSNKQKWAGLFEGLSLEDSGIIIFSDYPDIGNM
jgi:hypothetical protein